MAYDFTREILTRNIGIKIIALLIALISWIFVVFTADPVVKRDKKIKIEVKGLNDRLVINKDVNKVKITLRGKRKDIITSNNGVYAYIDIRSYKEIGQYEVPIIVFKPDELEIVKVIPDSLSITLKNIISRDIEVDYQIRGRNGFYYEKNVQLPEKVEVLGDIDEVKRCYTARANINLENLNPGKHPVRSKIEIFDREYNKIDNVRIDPEYINVFFEIKRFPIDQKKVVPQFSGKPKKGFEVYSTTIEPEEIDIEALPDVLDSIENIKTEIISLEGIDRSFTKKIRIPENEKYNILGDNKVKITVLLKERQDAEEVE